MGTPAATVMAEIYGQYLTNILTEEFAS